MNNKRIFFILLTVVLLLLIPLIAMQFTSEVNWTAFDFIVAAVLLLGTFFSVDFFIRKVKNIKLRIFLVLFLLTLLILLWIELSVGIFETTLSGQ